MHRAELLIVTAFAEVATGLLLLVLPSVPLILLLGIEDAAPEALFVARCFGAALLAIGVACWLGQGDTRGPAQLGLISGVLVYDAIVAVLLIYARLFLSLTGFALWPGVALHTALAFWCVSCLRRRKKLSEI